jgi:hypothetical protein
MEWMRCRCLAQPDLPGRRIVFLKILRRNGSRYDARVTIWAPA